MLLGFFKLMRRMLCRADLSYPVLSFTFDNILFESRHDFLLSLFFF
ncbi:hypothetical protein GGP51_003121 [Salinibacter ruber]|uniref:Uncharacterized protein n=1 Tax=Salinibacter ruber TaxID=146919 RepID=A0A9X2UBQ0_9BACT|nr:hypothetical protein [Salinibacter ruber]MCS4191625.1 hypothetical protein [Salinibacter ruber]